MGKDWFLWGRSARKREKNKQFEIEKGPPPGCIGSMFQLLNFSTVKSNYFIEDHPIPTKEKTKTGLEAPRNSLEEEESVNPKENSLKPVAIRIKTCGGISKIEDNKTLKNSSLDIYAVSPSANTPNLVARLMGLNHLPENFYPSLPSLHSSKSSKAGHKESLYQRNHSINSQCSFNIDITGSCSLPESPRTSVSRRSDVEYHRLSLQSCKENVSGSDNNKSQRKNKKVRQENEGENQGRSFGMDIKNIDITSSHSLPESPRTSVSRRSDVEHHRLSLQSCKENVSDSDNNKSQRKNKKVRQENEGENQGRSFGMDISNTTMRNNEHRRDHALLANPKKPLKKKSQENQVLSLSSQGVKNKKENVKKKTESFENKHFGQSMKRMEKSSNVVGSKKENKTVRRLKENRENKLKKTPNLGEIVDMSVTPVFPVKKEALSPTKLVSKQESEAHFSKRRTKSPSCLVKPYYNPHMACDNSGRGVTKAQFHYIIQVLKFLGIEEHSPVLFTKLRSPSHPLHPSVFNFLELTFSGSIDSQLCHRSNRILIFELVDELLVDVLNPYLNLKPWLYKNTGNVYRKDGSSLINQLLAKIRSLHAADCRVLEDIDGLINKDFHKTNFRISVALEEQSETIVAKLESDIMDSLVHDLVLKLLFGWETIHE